jgi:hypothetical protein
MTGNHRSLPILAVIVLQLAVARIAAGQDDGNLNAEVKTLGRGGDDFKIVEHLSTRPQQSVQLLIDELHTVEGGRILAADNKPEPEHILWCIRALRYLTGGMDFCGKTGYHFGTSDLEKNREYWLHFKSKSCVPFFAMWPSRGSEYIAPPDAQREIIRQWKGWLASEGKAFHYTPLKDPKPEAWLW